MSVSSVDELREVVLGDEPFRVVGGESCLEWLPPYDGLKISLDGFNYVVDFRPDDLIIRVGAGFGLDELDEMLAEKELCLPVMRDKGWLGYPGKTVGGLVAMGLPHWGFGSVRDLVLGMQFMTGDGVVVESGANVVKSVAGFDLHRMMVGSRGGLGVILEVVLRLYPMRMKPLFEGEGVFGATWIHRVPRSFVCSEAVRHGEHIWASRRLGIPPDGWILGPMGEHIGAVDPIATRFRANLKNELDPRGVLIEGWKR